jgi:hypothetical protein
VYRGSEAFLQYVGQGTSFLQDFTTFAAGGKVISYYNTAFNIMWNNSMAADVQALHMANPSYQLWVNINVATCIKCFSVGVWAFAWWCTRFAYRILSRKSAFIY